MDSQALANCERSLSTSERNVHEAEFAGQTREYSTSDGYVPKYQGHVADESELPDFGEGVEEAEKSSWSSVVSDRLELSLTLQTSGTWRDRSTRTKFRGHAKWSLLSIRYHIVFEINGQ